MDCSRKPLTLWRIVFDQDCQAASKTPAARCDSLWPRLGAQRRYWWFSMLSAIPHRPQRHNRDVNCAPGCSLWRMVYKLFDHLAKPVDGDGAEYLHPDHHTGRSDYTGQSEFYEEPERNDRAIFN